MQTSSFQKGNLKMNSHALQHFIANNFLMDQMHLAAINEMEMLAEKVQFRKNEILFAEGKVPHKFAFIEQGNLMSYSIINGKKTVHRFWFKGQPIFLSTSFLQKVPLQHSVIALNDCSMITLSYSKIMQISKSFTSIWEIINLFNTYENQLLQEYIALLSLEPKARYHNLMHQHPELWQLLTADLLASYLKIGYSTFARFRQGR